MSDYIVTYTKNMKSCPCGLGCPLIHTPIDGPHRARYGFIDWGNGFRTTMLPACEARKSWRGEWPDDLRPPTSVPSVPGRKRA